MSQRRTSEPVAQAERLLLELARFGNGVNGAMSIATRSPEFIANAPLLVMCLLDLDGPARPGAIAEVVGLTTGGTTKLLDRMESAGLIRRSYGVVDGDNRGVEVALTPSGRRTLRVAAAALVEHLDEATTIVKHIVSLLDSLTADSLVVDE